MELYFYLIIAIVIFVLSSLKQINEYERGVRFTTGKYSGIMTPGWRFLWPVFQAYRKIDMRVKAVDVPDQKAITRDIVIT